MKSIFVVDIIRQINGIKKMALSNKTLKFLEQHSTSTSKDSVLVLNLERELEQNPEILNELSQELDKLFVETEEDLSDSFSSVDLSSIENVYKSVLNNYDLNNLISLAIECLNQKVPWEDVERQFCLNAIKTFVGGVNISEANLALANIQNVTDLAQLLVSNQIEFEQSSSDVENFVVAIRERFDISELCNELSSVVDNFASLIDFSALLSNEGALFKNKLPDVPTFMFPDNLPTVDFIQSIREQAENSIRQQVLSFIVSSISTVLQQILQDQCLPNDQFAFLGHDNPFDKVGLRKNIRDQLTNKFGVGSGESLALLVEQTSRVLSTGEFCGLLKGKSNTDVFKIIEKLVEVNFSDLRNILKDEESMLDLFTLLSNAVVDLNICEDILESGGVFGPCFDKDVLEFRRCLLSNQGIEEKQIEELLKNIEENNKQDLEKLFELLSRSNQKEIDLSKLCEIDENIELFKALEEDFSDSTIGVVDSILTTVGMSYDQAVSSYVQRLLKDVDAPTRQELSKTVPTLVDNVVDKLKQTYNNQFSTGMAEFSEQGKELKNIIENSVRGQESINDFIDLQKAEELNKTGKLFLNKRKKVQPELKDILENGSFVYPNKDSVNLSSNNNTITFDLPEKETSKVNQVFEGKKYSSILPLKVEDKLNFSIFAQKDDEGFVVETCQANYTSLEQRISVKSFERGENEGDCKIYKVYLPISFGLASYSPLYKTKISNSQPLFPDYGAIKDKYYPQITPYDPAIGSLVGVGVFNHLRQQLQKLLRAKTKDAKQRLLDNHSNRLFPYVLNSMSRVKRIETLALGPKISEYDLWQRFYDVNDARKNFKQEDTDLVLALLEKHWIETVWENLRVAYYYKIYDTGEAYLVKVDLNEKISTNVEDDVRYGGPKMNIDDYASYNVMNTDQNNWSANNLWAKFSRFSKDYALNPLQPFAGLQTPMKRDHESRNDGSSISKGVIEFRYGIPANAKARKESWTLNKTGITVERFGQQYSLLPTYFGDFVRMSDSDIQKEDAIFGKTDVVAQINFKNTQQSQLLSNFDKKRFSIAEASRNGKVLIPKSAIPVDNSVQKQYQITNILNIGNDPLESLKNQGIRWFPGENIVNSQEKYEIKRSQERYNAVKIKDVILVPSMCIGYNRVGQLAAESPAQWHEDSIEKLSKKGKDSNFSLFEPSRTNSLTLNSNISNDNLYSFLWANIIIKSLEERFPNLSEAEKSSIRDYYTKKDGYLVGFSGFIAKFSDYVATSPIFQTFETTNQNKLDYTVDDTGDDRGLNETNLLELINFSPKFTASLPNCNVDVDLIRLSEIRRDVVSKYEDIIKCFRGDEATLKQLNVTVATAIVKIMIRLYAIELVLGSIFFFSRFDLRLNDIDDIMVEFVASKVMSGLQDEAERRNDSKLVSDFMEIVGAIFLDDTNQDLDTVDCKKKALNELCRKQIMLASTRLKSVLYTPSVIKNNSFDLQDVFQNVMTPFVDLPIKDLNYRSSGGRFIYTNTKDMSDLQKKQFSRLFVGFDELEKRSEIYDIENIGFYYEKYVVPKYKNPPQEKVLNGIVSLDGFERWLSSQPNLKSNDELSKYLDGLKVGMRLVYRPVGGEFQLLKNIVKAKVSDLNYETKDYYEPGTEQSTSDFFVIQQIIKGKWIVPTSTQGVQLAQDIKVELHWLVNDSQDALRVKSMLRGNNWNTDLLTAQNKNEVKIYVDVDNTFKGDFEEFIAKYDKSYTSAGSFFKNEDIYEFLEGLYNNERAPKKTLSDFTRGKIIGPSAPPEKFRTRKIVGESILLPMAKVESSVDLSCKISDISTITKYEEVVKEAAKSDDCSGAENQVVVSKDRIEVNFVEEYNKCYENKFKNEIKKQDIYDIIFENIFSITKISNILALYILLYNRNTTDILNMFDGVKNNLFSLLENINNLDTLGFKNSKILGFGGEQGIFNPSTNLNENFDFSRLFNLNSIRNSTPYIILKGLMETFDPNIAPSKKISDVANNYKRDIINSARPLLDLVQRRENGQELTQVELDDITASQWLIDLAKELSELPDLPVHIPSVFFMVTGIIPSPLGFAYLGFESILGQDILERIQNNSNLKAKIEAETGVSLDSAKEFANSLETACFDAS